MVKVITVAIYTVVAGETIRAEGEQMGLGEGQVDLAVAGLAGVQRECGDVAMMAIVTNKRFIPSREPMSI